MAIFLWNKRYGETLAETLQRFRFENPQMLNEKVTYAGRLDPLAEGLLVLLSGDDVHRKEEFLIFDKEYEIDFFFGIETDSFDVLGIPQSRTFFFSQEREEKALLHIKKFLGTFMQEYPAFSSKTVQGKPLFVWAREGKLDEIAIPQKEVSFFDIQYIQKREVDCKLLLREIREALSRVNGDFRQEEILSSWQQVFTSLQREGGQKEIGIHRILVKASSGAYMRDLISRLGKESGLGAVSLRIERKAIGSYRI